ncbi:MAG: phytochelatin synthase family protein, partial [Burkholderiales bacterium]
MRSIGLLIALLAILSLSYYSNIAYAVEIVPWHSSEGIKRLERSQHKIDFFTLSNQFETQINKLYCGLASSAIVLNALRLHNPHIEKPQDHSHLPSEHRTYLPKDFDPILMRYTQNTVLHPHIKELKHLLGKPITISGKQMADYGLQLHELAELLQSHDLEVLMRTVTPDTPEALIRRELLTNLNTKDDYVLINYHRATFNQPGNGHISPLA